MAIKIREAFRVQAPIEEVWRFVMDPHRVAACMPGAALDEVVDERTYLGSISVKVGPINARYKGRVELSEIDDGAHSVRIQAEGREQGGGGTARGTMHSRLEPLPEGATQVEAEATVQLSGRVAQFGQGMIQEISQELFQQFVACARQQLEGEEAAAESVARASEPIPIAGLLLRALWSAVVRLLKRVFRRGGRQDR